MERIIASAVAGPNGQRWNTTSFRTSTKMPPRPNIAIGPNTGSRWMPRMHSTPPFSCFATSTPSIRASGAAALARSSSSANPDRTESASDTSSSTPPISDLCRMSGDRIFITTGNPNRAAAATAASAVAHSASGADAIPAPASSRFASASVGVAAGNVTGGTEGAASTGPAANAAPNRPIASTAVTARVGSSCTTQPSDSSSSRRSGGTITERT